jgi:hypothetical protein
LFREWVRLNPAGFPGEYFANKIQMLEGRPVQFEDGKFYLLSENRDKFVEVKS